MKTEGLYSIMEAGHLQALLVFKVLSNCEVGLSEGSDNADIRVYMAIAMAQQLIYADPPTKRIQYKRLQEVSGVCAFFKMTLSVILFRLPWLAFSLKYF